MKTIMGRLRETIKDHPLASVAAYSVLLIGITFGVLEYVHREQDRLREIRHDIDLGKLEGELAAIHRRLGPDQDLDIRKLIMPKGQVFHARLSSSAHFFDKEGFYASKDSTFWKYSEVGAEPEEIRGLPKAIADLAAKGSLHVWERPEQVKISTKGRTIELSPWIVLSRIPLEAFEGILAFKAKLGRDSAQDAGLKIPDKDWEEFVEGLNKAFRGDAAGVYLSGFLPQIFGYSIADQVASVELVNVQKVGNLVYLQILTDFGEVKIDGKSYAHYYARSEVLLTTTATDLFFVIVSAPGSDPSGRDKLAAEITKWFSDLAILL